MKKLSKLGVMAIQVIQAQLAQNSQLVSNSY